MQSPGRPPACCCLAKTAMRQANADSTPWLSGATDLARGPPLTSGSGHRPAAVPLSRRVGPGGALRAASRARAPHRLCYVRAEVAAALVGAEHGVAMQVVGPLVAGEARAHEVVWAPAGRGVLKQYVRPSDRQSVARALPLVEKLRARGFPVPKAQFTTSAPDALLVVREWMPGRASDVVDHRLVDDVLRLQGLQVGLGTQEEEDVESWGRLVLRAVRHGLDPVEGYCLHDPLRQHSARASELLFRVRKSVNRVTERDFVALDIAHFDFHHRNLLVTDRGVVAVIDWDGARTADAIFDLVTLAFCSVTARCEAGAVERLWSDALRLRPRPVVAAYAALLAVRQVDWAIRHRPDAEVAIWLGAAESALDSL